LSRTALRDSCASARIPRSWSVSVVGVIWGEFKKKDVHFLLVK
jgi:hypothetical protein